ncbi:glycosyltransferase family 1 protein [bacterium]|nr:glycosyltransferase family 1 protein [bacterium]
MKMKIKIGPSIRVRARLGLGIEDWDLQGTLGWVSGPMKIRVSLDATAIGRGKTGNETYLNGLLEGWREAKPEGVEILPLSSQSTSPRAPYPTREIPHTGFFKRHLVELPKARGELKTDLYHGIYWVRPWESEPYVLTVHDISFEVHPEWFRPGEAWFYRTLVRRAAERARKVITVSEFCRNEIMERWGMPADRVETTYEAARKIYRPGKRKKGGPPSLLFVSAIHPRKNLGRLIRVWRRLRAGRFPDLELKVIGPAAWSAGPDLRALREAVQTAGAKWLGPQTDEELKEAYLAATLLVYPSLYEGFGLPPLEAMACGCPVVCSRTGSLPEVCGGAVEYFDPTSEDEMAAQMGLILDSSSRQEELRAKGLERSGAFSWARTAEETADIYRRAME